MGMTLILFHFLKMYTAFSYQLQNATTLFDSNEFLLLMLLILFFC